MYQYYDAHAFLHGGMRLCMGILHLSLTVRYLGFEQNLWLFLCSKANFSFFLHSKANFCLFLRAANIHCVAASLRWCVAVLDLKVGTILMVANQPKENTQYCHSTVNPLDFVTSNNYFDGFTYQFLEGVCSTIIL